MVIPHTGKTCPSRRKPRLSRESGRLDLTGRPIFHQRTAIICESWMSFWDPSNSYPSFQRLLRRYELPAIGWLSLPFFAQPVAFSELLWQFFSFFVSLQLGMTIPVRAVSPCDGGHGAAAGFAQLLLPSAVGHLCFFCARPQGMPESSWLSWPECGRTSALQSVQFWPLGDYSSTASKRWLGGKSLSGKRQRTSYAIIRPPQSSVTEG